MRSSTPLIYIPYEMDCLMPQLFCYLWQSRSTSLTPRRSLGYTLYALHETKNGLTAHLSLAGPACNAFGRDINNLTLRVTYDTKSRSVHICISLPLRTLTSAHLLSLHVNIYDTAESQFAIPSSVIELDSGSKDASLKRTSDLVFNYESSPFAFWITRRSEPHAQPLFDTRASSLPQTPIPPVIANDTSTALDGFPLVFEDQYLQLTSALPLGANVYGLGEVVASSGFRRDVGTDGGVGTIQTMWARDIADPIDQNVYVLISRTTYHPVDFVDIFSYGSHPIYMEHRYNATTQTSQTHGVFLYR